MGGVGEKLGVRRKTRGRWRKCVLGLDKDIHPHAHMSNPQRPSLHVVQQARSLRDVPGVETGAEGRLACVFGACQ